MAKVRGVNQKRMQDILSDLRIVEVAAFVAAPLGGMTLAKLGADVIRIDPIGGSGTWCN